MGLSILKVWLSPWTRTTGLPKAMVSSSSARLKSAKPEGSAVSSSKGFAWITSITAGLPLSSASSNVSASHSRFAALRFWYSSSFPTTVPSGSVVGRLLFEPTTWRVAKVTPPRCQRAFSG